MKILLWLCYLPIHIGIFFIRYPLAPIAVLLFSTPDKRHLTHLRWLETLDNDLTGDTGWQVQHIKGDDPFRFWNRVGWLWRNGGNAVNYDTLGCEWYPPEWSGLPAEVDYRGWYWRKDGYWLYRKVWWGYLEIFWGWNLYGHIDRMCKFTFTTRKYNG